MAMKYSYRTMGTCSSQIDFEVENGVLKDVRFMGGCNGNLKGISALAGNRPLVPTSSARLCGKLWINL